MTNEIIAMIGVGGLLTAIASQVWLVLLIMRGSPPLALLALVIPFFTWYFALQNWDIAKRPILLQVGGLVVVIGTIPFIE
jgi:hypothetical protein